jgi:thiamine biosynthesis lipoprotein
MNIAMGSVLSIWHDYRTAGLDDYKNASLPPMSDLQAAAEHVNIDDIIIDDENNTVFLADPKMKLDVGAFAKGYAVEMVARMLEDMGKTGYTLNVGGNIRTIGTKYNGDMWKAGIENPADTTTYIEYISLAGEAVVTSGSYQRYYIVNGKSYHRIIDIDTLMPAEKGFLSVSVICKDSGMGDGLSTALFCMTLEEGMALVNSLEGVEAMWVTTKEVKHYSNGFDQYITK